MKALALGALVVAFSVTALADKTGTTTKMDTTTKTMTSTTTTTGTTPATVCAKLVEAAKANKYEEFTNLATNYTGHQGKKAAGPAKFNKMHTDFMDKIKEMNCGTEHVGGMNAFVEADAGGTKRFIPFVNVEGTWKFDAKTYMTFYPVPGKGAKKGM